MNFFNDYMVMAVVGICLCVGYIIKFVIANKVLNQYIPLIVCVLGIFVNLWINGFTVSPEIILAGMLSGLASTGMYEMLRNFIESFSKKEE